MNLILKYQVVNNKIEINKNCWINQINQKCCSEIAQMAYLTYNMFSSAKFHFYQKANHLECIKNWNGCTLKWNDWNALDLWHFSPNRRVPGKNAHFFFNGYSRTFTGFSCFSDLAGDCEKGPKVLVFNTIDIITYWILSSKAHFHSAK